MKGYLYGAVLAFGFCAGVWAASCHYTEKIAGMQQAHAEAVAAQEKRYAEAQTKATDTILVAQEQYDIVRRDRDEYLKRLRVRAASAGTGKAGAAEADGAGAAACEGLVRDMAEAAAACHDGWSRCAAKHDALADLLR